MIRDLVFHLGDTKTGSTSIQQVLVKGLYEAEGKTLLYPARVNHRPLARTFLDKDARPQQARRFARVREPFETAQADIGIVSSEDFEWVDPEALDAALRAHMPEFRGQVRLIAYIRPHPAKFVSEFAERSKKGNCFVGLAALHARLKETPTFRYAERLRRWRAVFGDRFTARPMIRDRLAGKDVVVDFMGYVFGETPVRIKDYVTANESLSVEDLAMLREIHRRIRKSNPDLVRAQMGLGWNMSPLLAAHAAPGGTKPALHKGLAEDVAETYLEDARAIDAEFFDGSPMADALEEAVAKAVEAPQSFEAPDHYGPRVVGQLRAWADMLQRLMEADPEEFYRLVRPEEERWTPSGKKAPARPAAADEGAEPEDVAPEAPAPVAPAAPAVRTGGRRLGVRRLLLHVGDAKTGSTSIQYALAHGKISAKGVAWVYPSERGHNILARGISERRDRTSDEVFGKLRAKLEAADADLAILSAELLEFIPPDQVDAAFRAYLPEVAGDMRVLAYCRPHGAALVSRFATQLKVGLFTSQIAAFHRTLVRRRRLFYAERYGAWAEVFGDRMTVRPMVRRELYKGDVVTDFARVAFETDDVTLDEMPVLNPSLSLEVLMALRVLHRGLARHPEYGVFRESFGRSLSRLLEVAAGEMPATKLVHDRELAEAVRETYAEDAPATDARWFTGTPMADGMVEMMANASPKPVSTLPRDHLSQAMLDGLRDWTRKTVARMPETPTARDGRELADEALQVLRALFVAESAPGVTRPG